MYSSNEFEKNHRQYINIFNRCLDGVIIFDTIKNEIVYLNDSFINLFNYSVEEFLPIGLQFLTNQMTHDDIERQIENIKRGEDSAYIVELRKKDGQLVQIETRYFQLLKDDIYVCGYLKNLTREISYIKDQRYKENRLNQFLNILNNISKSLDYSKGEISAVSHNMVESISKAIDVDRVSIRLYNLDRSELSSLALFDRNLDKHLKGKLLLREEYSDFFDYIENHSVLHSSDISKNEVLHKLISVFFSQDGMISSLLISRIILDGYTYGYIFFQSRTVLEWDSEIILFANQIANHFAILLLNQRLIQNQEILEVKVLERTNELEKLVKEVTEANDAKKRFLSHMSHEIRTPLSAIIGYLNLIDLKNNQIDNQRFIDRINDGANDLLSIINDVLDFSKIESGKLEYHPKPTILSDVFMNVLSLYEQMNLSKKISFSYHIDLKKKNYLADSKIIKQIMHNLLSNAYKFTTTGYIKVVIVDSITGSSDLNQIMIEISDTGIGIRESELDKVFNSFQQTESSSITNVKGTGLGLAITKELVHIMNGKIEIKSVFGQGTTFNVILPLKSIDFKEVKQKNQTIASSNHKKLNVLVVDDNNINIEIIKEQLISLNYKPDIATNGFEALKSIENNQYDIVFMDIHMPILNGIKAVNLIRMNPKNNNIRIVAMTANAYEFNGDQFKNYGFDSVLIKPMTKDELQKTLIKMAYEDSNKSYKNLIVDTKIDSLKKCLDLDTEMGITYSGENETLYLKLLDEFVLSHSDSLDLIIQSLSSRDFDLFYREVHTLKGLSKLLGMKEIYNNMNVIENLYKEERNIDDIIERVKFIKPEYDFKCYGISHIFKYFEKRGGDYA
jgi:signal transduction histidine kinase/CheY-like chemotaxis protein/HPt (histidine-containing phosphotransfer) domain-containing protein